MSILVEHCLSELQNSDHTRDRFWSILRLKIPKNINDFRKSNQDYQIVFIQTLLSKGVMSFLDVDIEKHTDTTIIFQKLNNLLLSNFVKICFGEGKGLYTALKTIDGIYNKQIKIKK